MMKSDPTDLICSGCGAVAVDPEAHISNCQGPFPESWWHEDIGTVVWWCWRDGEWLSEAPMISSPLCLGHTVELHVRDAKHKVARLNVGGWPGYHTHWTHLPPLPPPPKFFDPVEENAGEYGV